MFFFFSEWAICTSSGPLLPELPILPIHWYELLLLVFFRMTITGLLRNPAWVVCNCFLAFRFVQYLSQWKTTSTTELCHQWSHDHGSIGGIVNTIILVGMQKTCLCLPPSPRVTTTFLPSGKTPMDNKDSIPETPKEIILIFKLKAIKKKVNIGNYLRARSWKSSFLKLKINISSF